jgi:hypothetical protein
LDPNAKPPLPPSRITPQSAWIGTIEGIAPFDFDVGPLIAPPSAPTGLGATDTETTTPKIFREEQAGAAYTIWYINSDSKSVISGATNLSTAWYEDPAALGDGNYRFWVRVFNVLGSSGWAGPYDLAAILLASNGVSSYVHSPVNLRIPCCWTSYAGLSAGP